MSRLKLYIYFRRQKTLLAFLLKKYRTDKENKPKYAFADRTMFLTNNQTKFTL